MCNGLFVVATIMTVMLVFQFLSTCLLLVFCEGGLYSLSAEDAAGKTVALDQFRGKVSLVVNVASDCGYTDANYKHLVQLQRDYQAKGFTVLAFPCNQFGDQEPASNQKIQDFASEVYGTNFPIFGKTNVTGEQTCEVYNYLRGNMGSVPTWNFSKYLVDRAGAVVQFFSVKESFSDIRTSVEYLLGKHSDEL